MNAKVENNRLILIPETDLIASRVEMLRTFMTNQIQAHPEIPHIQLDVNGVNFVDSLGVNLIVGVYQQANASSKTLEIIRAGENFKKVADFFRLSSLFPVKGMGE